MDIVFKGGKSPYVAQPDEHGLRIIVKCENNERDPMELYRFVRFNASKKERRIQWQNIDPAILGDAPIRGKRLCRICRT